MGQMASGSHTLLWAGLGLGVAYLWWDETPIKLRLGSRAPLKARAVEELANHWGPLFGAPPHVLVVLASIESSFDPSVTNVTPRALLRGGAWGLVQQTLETAKGHAAALQDSPNPEVQTMLASWDGSGPGLLDPNLNMMFAARQVGRLAAEFSGRLDLIAAGYHGGRGAALKVRDLPPGEVAAALTAKGHPNSGIYVGRALSRERSLYA
jgi:soluble lytic murein transglycosylase-like protein